jgi:hypothetical protein
MAASGYTPIILFNSGTSGHTPTTGNLAVGELAINYADGKLFYNNGSSIVTLANASLGTLPVGVAYGGTGITTTPVNGALLIGNGTGYTSATLTAGSNITITNSSGAITIAAAGTSSTYTRTSFTATSGQTTFSVTYTVGYLQVYLNGVLLNGTDYTATNGTSVVLATGAASGDIVETVAYSIVSIGTSPNIAGGSAGEVVYQSGASATSFTAVGTSGQPLLSGGTSSPTWGTLSTSYGGTGSTTLTFPAGTASIGYLNIPQNSQSAAYTTVAADAGTSIFHPSSDANARTFTIAANASVPYALGTVIQFINMSSSNVTIAINSDTLTWAQGGGTGSRTLAQYGVANAIKIATTQWLITGTNLT